MWGVFWGHVKGGSSQPKIFVYLQKIFAQINRFNIHKYRPNCVETPLDNCMFSLTKKIFYFAGKTLKTEGEALKRMKREAYYPPYTQNRMGTTM